MENSGETAEALLFLANYCKSQGKYDEALIHAKQLHECYGADREEAGALIKEIS